MSTAAPCKRPSRRSDKRFIGARQRIARDLAGHARLRRDLQEFMRVGAGEIRHRHHMPLLPQQRIRKARNVRHVDAAADHAPALAHRFERRRHQRADRCEDDGGVERFRRHLVRAAGPHGAERAREVLRRAVALAREGEHAPPLPDRDLRQDMGSGAKAVKAERLAVAGHAIAAPADQPGAQPGRDFGVVPVSPNGKQ